MTENNEEREPSAHRSNNSQFDGLKQRLIGAIVLVSLAVIFLPMLFDEPHQERKNIIVPIPDRPAEKIVTFEAAEKPVFKRELNSKSLETLSENKKTLEKYEDAVVEKNNREYEPIKSEVIPVSEKKNTSISKDITTKKVEKTEKAKVSATNKKVESKPNDKPVKSLNNAWIVQLGVFSNQSNAIKLRDKARAQGFSTHTKSVQKSDKNLTRVFSGPFVNKKDADRVKRVLDNQFKVNSIVVRFSD